MRRAVREEVRRDLADTGGPIEAEAKYRIAGARRHCQLGGACRSVAAFAA